MSAEDLEIVELQSKARTLTAEVERLKHQLEVSHAFEERIKIALRQPGVTGSYVEWAAECRAAYDEVERLREALERILEEDDPAVMDGIALNALAATQPSTQGDRDETTQTELQGD